MPKFRIVTRNSHFPGVFHGRIVKKVEFFSEIGQVGEPFSGGNLSLKTTYFHLASSLTEIKYTLTVLQFQVPVDQAEEVFFNLLSSPQRLQTLKASPWYVFLTMKEMF